LLIWCIVLLEWIASINNFELLLNWTRSNSRWISSFIACIESMLRLPLRSKHVVAAIVSSQPKKCSLVSWKQRAVEVTLESTTRTTLHFIHLTPGFSHWISLGSFFQRCSWWTVNYSFQTTSVILSTWLGDWILSFQILSFQLCKMHQNNDTTIPTVAASTFLHIANTLTTTAPWWYAAICSNHDKPKTHEFHHHPKLKHIINNYHICIKKYLS
jgi:hypothetical protein